MIEVEIRILLEDAKAIETILKNKFPIIKQKHQVDEYFSHPTRNFYANAALHEYLRIRQDSGSCSLDYHIAHITKGKKMHTEEFEVKVEDAQKLREILLNLGFKPLVVVDKDRKIFDCTDFEACLDSIKDLGNFLEIEAKRDFGGIEKTRQECIDFLKNIGIDYKPAPEMGYPDMLIERLAKNNNRSELKIQ